MKIDILTLFPEMFDGVLNQSILKRAQEAGHVTIDTKNFRKYGLGKHERVDDTPYGGGAGMLLKPEPIFEAVEDLQTNSQKTNQRIILVDPVGKPFDQAYAEDLSQEEHLVFICGHYEGYDERIRTLATDEISIGDYVLTSGELAAMVMTDAVVRLLPGVLGNRESAEEDSFSNGLLEHPHYTRPPEYLGMQVPDVLMSGDHGRIDEWRYKESLRRTYERRPDLLADRTFTDQEKTWLEEFKKEKG